MIRASAERQPHLALALYTGLATIAGENGRTDEARALLDRIVAEDPFGDGDDLMATLHAVHIAEAAVAVDHVEAANAVSDVLDAHVGAVGLLATGHLCFGAIDRARGDVARTQGRLDDAIECYERAIDIEEAIGARIYANRSRLGLAIALAARDARRRPRAGRVPRPGGACGWPRSSARRWSPTPPRRYVPEPGRPASLSPGGRLD